MTPEALIRIVQWHLMGLDGSNAQQVADKIAHDASCYLDEQADNLLREINAPKRLKPREACKFDEICNCSGQFCEELLQP